MFCFPLSGFYTHKAKRILWFVNFALCVFRPPLSGVLHAWALRFSHGAGSISTMVSSASPQYSGILDQDQLDEAAPGRDVGSLGHLEQASANQFDPPSFVSHAVPLYPTMVSSAPLDHFSTMGAALPGSLALGCGVEPGSGSASSPLAAFAPFPFRCCAAGFQRRLLGLAARQESLATEVHNRWEVRIDQRRRLHSSRLHTTNWPRGSALLMVADTMLRSWRR